MNALAADSGLRLRPSADQSVVDVLRADAEHYRALYRATFALAVALQRTVTRQEAIIRENDALWSRCARQFMMPCGECDE